MSVNKQDETKPLTFVLSDDSLNCYGFRVLTNGIDLSVFKKNPTMLWNHNRPWRGTKDEILPIGHWENIRKEDGKLLADAVFDENDDFAQSIKSKVEQGILNMASIGYNAIVTSEDKAVLVPGQTRPTVIKSFLKEASICVIGANRNAFCLCDAYGVEINLSDNDSNHLLPLLSDMSGENPENTNQQTNTNMELREQIAGTLNLADGVNDEAVHAAVQGIQTENVTLKERITGYEKAESEALSLAAKEVVNAAILERRLTESDRAAFESMALADIENTKMVLARLPAAIDLSDKDAQGGTVTLSAADTRKAEIEANKRR